MNFDYESGVREKEKPKNPMRTKMAKLWVKRLLKSNDIEGLIVMAEHCLTEDGGIPAWAHPYELIGP